MMLNKNKPIKPDTEDRVRELPDGAGVLTLAPGWELIQCGEYGEFVTHGDTITFAVTMRRHAAVAT